MISRVGVQRDDAFLRLPLEARRIGDARCYVCFSDAACSRYRSLANLGTIMIENHDGGWLSGKGRIDPFHLHGTGQLLCVLRGGDGQASCCHVCHLPDAPVGIESQTTERELDRRTARRRVLDQDKRLRFVRATTTQYGCGSIGIPPQDVFGKMLSGRDGAQSPLLKSLACIHLTLLEFRLVASEIREEARKSDLHERPGTIGPPELAVEVLLHLRLLAGLRVDLPCQERIVVTDTHITMRQSFEVKDARGVRAGDMGVDSDVQQASGASVAHFDHSLQCGNAHQVAAQHSLHLLCGTRAHDCRPVCGGLYGSRAGLRAELDARCGCGWWLCGPRRTPASAVLVTG